ncbi:hypothetical protein JW711_05810 [Candidatus Woesearchaeota archaeon]|nr:hypothetical protein [Candidatus Woesearchaeota archaeon]
MIDRLVSLSQTELMHSSHRRKRSTGLQVTIDDVEREAGVSLSCDQYNYFSGKSESHLARLILPELYSDHKFVRADTDSLELADSMCNSVCYAFGTALLRYAASKEIYESYDANGYKESEKFSGVVGTEGEAVFVFWTIAPYVHMNLVGRGLSSEESISEIVNWAKRSFSPGRAENPLSYCNNSVDVQLGLDERMPSHLHANILSQNVVNRMLAWR